jgi:CheY-like chemotaxis protein
MSTVLVVEDSQPAREVVMRILKREGYDVLGAANGIEALVSIERESPDLVLLDVMMPEMDGMTMLEELRENPETRELPVILLTALSDEPRLRKARELGVREYLVKTRFSYEELLEHVNKHVRH